MPSPRFVSVALDIPLLPPLTYKVMEPWALLLALAIRRISLKKNKKAIFGCSMRLRR